MLKRFLKKVIDRVINYKRYRDTRKLLSQPRYQGGKSSLFKFPFYYVDASTFYDGYKELIINEPYRFNSKSDSPLILDCGANIGLSVVYFKNLYPKAKIHAFEPDPTIFETLKKNIELNNLSNVELVNKAIWTDNNNIEFEVEGGLSGRINKYGSEINLINVKCQRLKDLLIKYIDFLKIDIEGAEYEVLKDCSENLSVVKNLFIEYHSHKDETQKLGELLLLLSERGFRYHIKEAYTKKHPFVDQDNMLGMDLQLNIYAINTLL